MPDPDPPPGDPARACWNEPGQVAKFADRAADHRLVALLAEYEEPSAVQVLDLGCAGGRNTDELGRRGFDVHALDRADAMVARTRERLAAHVGNAEATRRVWRGEMRDLSAFGDGTFALVLALGIFHQAQDEAEWYEALAEAARVLADEGLLLVSNFAPGTGAVEAPLPRVGGTAFVHQGIRADRLCLREVADLDADLGRLGLVPEVATVLVVREVDGQRRVTANGLYRKRSD